MTFPWDILAAAGSIVQVEARHAAAIRLLNGMEPAPEAFDKPLDVATVTNAITPLIKQQPVERHLARVQRG